MVVDHTILHAHKEGRLDKYLSFDDSEKPLVLQLGGSDPCRLAEAARIAESYGYDELNLNVGCPSDRVQSGLFGACLMKEPERVAECLNAMRNAVSIPVSVKHRIGVDELDSYENMLHFVKTLEASGTTNFIVHARKAWLNGLSPAENRTVPLIRWEDVHRLKKELPHLLIEVNGEIRTLNQAKEQLHSVDGVMMGRICRDEPWVLARVDSEIYHQPDPFSDPLELLEPLQEYANRLTQSGNRPHALFRHIMGLFHKRAGARLWRRFVSETSNKEPYATDLLIRSKEILNQTRNG